MPHANSKNSRRLNPHAPLVFDTRTLGPAAVRSETRTAPAPASLGVELVNVPEGAELELDVKLEGVAEGVLVTATVRAPLVGECARCLDLFASSTEVRITELFTYEASDDDADGYLLDGDLLDLEPALRDALAHEAPLQDLAGELDAERVDEGELRRFGDPARLLFNVNAPDDLLMASAMLDRRRRVGAS